MALTTEWRNRIIEWLGELPAHFYRELGEVKFDFFSTTDELSAVEAEKRTFSPAPAGTAWGAKWEYGWFRGNLVLPDSAVGERVVLIPEFGAEALIYVNGSPAGARDKEHREITLSRDARPGTKFSILAEAYAGHGPREETVGPVPPGRIPVPEPGPTQAVVGRTSFGIWDDEAFGAWIDAHILFQLREALTEDSLRQADIDAALKEFTYAVDFELPLKERRVSFVAGRRALQRVLACRNGSTAPVMHAFGNSHLDLAWLWPFAETRRKSARTMANQLALLEEYPEYRYMLCQVPLMIALKEHYGELWDKTRELVRSGSVIVEGGMWLEPDTNLPNGESLIRQFIYGVRFMKDELGVDTKVLWLPDTFGFTAALPQIMAGCDIPYFATKKIADSYSGGEPFPHVNFIWRGIDGTGVAATIYRKCNSEIDPQTLLRRWKTDRKQLNGISSYLFPFGYGDGGGGPTRTHLENIRRIADLEGVPKVRMSDPVAYFEEWKSSSTENEWVGELYFQEHRGTYTTQAKTKRGNRLSEFALRRAELWGSIAAVSAAYTFPYDEMERLWKKILFTHFHDVITGASIARVYEEAEADYAEVVTKCDSIANEALSRTMASDTADLTVSNTLSWERGAFVPLPLGVAGAVDASGRVLSTQSTVDGQVWAETKVPACGWTTLHGLPTAKSPDEGTSFIARDERTLENELVRFEFDSFGRLIVAYDKETRRELTAAPCNEFRMYKDVTVCYDAWDIVSMYEKLPIPLNEKAACTVVDRGPLWGTIAVERNIGNSLLRQEIRLRAGSRRLDFCTYIDWKEDHKLLKVAFPTVIRADDAIHEIQFGHIHRPNHRSTRFAAERYEVCNHKWSAFAETNRGVAILNDGKYGIGARGGELTLTLLKAPFVPDMRADRGVHQFTYAFYFWNDSFDKSGLIREAYELNEPVQLKDGGAGQRSFFSVDSDNIIVETVKLAEDRSGDIILRMYESVHSTIRSRLKIELPISSASETNLLEKTQNDIALQSCGSGGFEMELDFRPFEIKTVRLKISRKL